MSADLAALLLGAAVLGAGVRRGWLTGAGLGAAVAVGGAVWWGSGPGGLALLLLFFVSSSVLTAPGSGDAEGRGARQVAANGGVAALAGVAGGIELVPGAGLAVAGALAAATADTWASEVGRRWGGATRHALTWRPVEPGATAGVSGWGSGAALAGALLVAVAGVALGVVPAELRAGAAVGLAGAVGAAADSALGATLEGRLAWFDNDAVNAAATLAGATTAWLAGVA